jgi:hypothetical protein
MRPLTDWYAAAASPLGRILPFAASPLGASPPAVLPAPPKGFDVLDRQRQAGHRL